MSSFLGIPILVWVGIAIALGFALLALFGPKLISKTKTRLKQPLQQEDGVNEVRKKAEFQSLLNLIDGFRTAAKVTVTQEDRVWTYYVYHDETDSFSVYMENPSPKDNKHKLVRGFTDGGLKFLLLHLSASQINGKWEKVDYMFPNDRAVIAFPKADN